MVSTIIGGLPRTANAILYGCNVCLSAIRVDDQQAKLDELERIVEGLQHQ